MPRTKQQFKEIRVQRQSQIMETALQLFANNGYHATSISQIAQETNISKGLIYNYFPSKEELLKKIIIDFSKEMFEMMNPNHDSEITLDEALGFIDIYFEYLMKEPEKIKLYFQLTMQPKIIDLLKAIHIESNALQTMNLFIETLAITKKEYAQEAFMTLQSILKGISLQYAFAPDFFPNESMQRFKEYIKEVCIK